MVQHQHRASFLLETPQTAFGTSQFLGQNFQSDLAAMLLRIFGQEDFSHAALAQSPQDAIMTDELRELICAGGT
jgi:hypothetical protein